MYTNVDTRNVRLARPLLIRFAQKYYDKWKSEVGLLEDQETGYIPTTNAISRLHLQPQVQNALHMSEIADSLKEGTF